MNKRIISLFLTIVLLSLPLCGCKPKNNNSHFGNQNTAGKSLPAAAVALANEIDRLTSVQDLLLGSTSASGLRATHDTFSTSTLSEVADSVYTRDPEDFEVTGDLGLEFQGANDKIEAMKQLKDEALTECTEPNVWFKVNSFSYAPRYRVTYHEENNDTVTVERNSDSGYSKATISHDENGKLAINAYSVGYSTEIGSRTSQIHYLEDSYIRIRYDEIDEIYGTVYEPSVLFVDLSNTSYTMVSPNYEYYEDGTVQKYADARICYWDGQYFVDSRSEYMLLYRDDKLIFQRQKDGLRGNKDSFVIFLNNCTGWSRIESFSDSTLGHDYYVLHTDTGEFRNDAFSSDSNDPYEYTFRFCFGFPGISLWWNPSYTQAREDVVNFLDDLQRDLGIVLPEADEQIFLDALFGYDELASQTHLMNGIYASDVTLEVYEQLLADMLVYDEVTREELAAMRQEDAIEKEQILKPNLFDTQGNSQGGMVNVP